MDTLYIVMPAYNEEANIENVIYSWYKLLEGKSDNSRLVVADSGSTDKTHEILEKLKDSYPKLDIISNGNQYHGPKVIQLYKYAIKNGADYIFQTDSDNQTNPDEFIYFWNNRKQYDVIIGKRVHRGDGRGRAFVEKIVCILLYIFFKVRVPDANAPFRLMECKITNKYINFIPDNYSLPNIILTVFFTYYRENIMFYPITFKPRTGGRNSIDYRKIIKIGLRSLADFRMFRKLMKKNNI